MAVMQSRVTTPDRTRRWTSILVAFSMIIGLIVAGASPATALVDDGSLDTSFGGGDGMATLSAFGGKDVAVDSQGRILVSGYAGYATEGSNSGFKAGVARFLADGTLDASFSGDGYDVFGTPYGSDRDYAGAVDVVVGPGDTVYVVTLTKGSSDGDFGIRRYTSSGVLDTTWNSTGEVTTDINGSDQPFAAALSGTDLLVAGRSSAGSVVAKYDSSGTLVSSFGTAGIATVVVNTYGSGYDQFEDIAIYDDGHILVSGTSTHSGATNKEPHVVRLTNTGALDATFGTGGKRVITEGGSGGNGRKLALVDPSTLTSAMLVAGFNNNRVYVERLDGSGNLDTGFSGDGVINYTTGAFTGEFVWGMALSGSNFVISGSDYSDAAFLLRANASTATPDTTFSTAGTAGWDWKTGTTGRDMAIDTNGRYFLLQTDMHFTSPSSILYGYNGTYEAPTAPGAPTSLAGTPGNTQVGLSWSAPSSDGGAAITDYKVEYQPSGGSWATFADGTSTSTTATVTSLTNGTAYNFRVSAINSVGTSTASSTAAATPATLSDAPTNLAGSIGNTQVGLSWSAPSSDGGAAITDYNIEYQPSGGSWATFADGTSTSTTATVTSLTNGTAYNFRVSAINSIGTSTTSTTAATTPATVPGAPINPAGSSGNTQINLSWTAPSSDGGSAITDYEIEYQPSGGSWATFADGTSSSASATVTSLTNGTAYNFRVSAINSVGTGPASTTAAATPAAVPGAPTNPAGSSGNAQVGLSWTAPSSDGGAAITDYKVEYQPSGGSWATFADGTSTSTTATVTSLTNGTAYNFRVSAINSVGTGTASSSAASMPATVPGAPTGLAGTAANSQVALSWSAPSGNGAAITDYKVEYQPSGGSWATFADGTSTSTTATVTSLTNGTAYNFRISAINSIGTSTTSASAAATPAAVPDAPSGLAGTPDNTQVGLSWSAPSSPGGAAITDYKVEYQPYGGSWATFADGTSTSTTATVTSLTNGTAYNFRISAINSIGTSTTSATAAATPATVPGAPSGVSGTAGSTRAELSWTAPSSNGGATITSYRATASPGGRSCVSTTTACTITGLTNGTAYTFAVTATNSAGVSTASTPSGSLTPTAATPPPAGPALSGCPTGSTPFTDITGSFAEADIACIRGLGITNGTSATSYGPKATVTREQMAAFLARLWRSMGRACPTESTPFTDISGTFAEADIACIRGLGITNGTSPTTFSPKATVTREQMAAFLARTWRALGHTFTSTTTPFTDLNGSFAEEDVACIRSVGITNGTGPTTYGPKDPVTREQMAAFLGRFIRAFIA